MPTAKQLKLRLFLEGIEVPVISANVSIFINNSAAASIQIIPLDTALNFYPRTMVHLFFLDKEGDDVGTYRLLFAGEIVGMSVVKNSLDRDFILQCRDFSSYWEAARATAIEYSPNGNAMENFGYVYGSNTGIFDDIVGQQPERLMQWIRSRPKTPGLQNVTGLAGGAIRVLEAMSGVPNAHRGVNDFFTVAQLRCRILEQLVAEENDATASNLLGDRASIQFITTGFQNIGQQVTFRDIINLLFTYVFYYFVPNPTAKYSPALGGSKESRVDSVSIRSTHETKYVISLLSSAIASGSTINNEFATIVDISDTMRGYLKEADKVLRSALSKYPSFSKDLRAVQNEVLKGLVTLDSKTLTKDKVTQTVISLGKASQIFSRAKSRKVETTVEVGASNARLKSHLILPECWYAAPPKCNIIFPEHYSSFTYDRNMLSETTRALVQTYSELIGNNVLTNGKIFVPPMDKLDEETIKTVKTRGLRTLMPHEYHTGIVPVMESLPNTFVNVRSGMKGEDKSTIKRQKLDWSVKAALVLFMRGRFLPRQASVAGRFNPFVVCGLPGVVIQKPFYVPRETLLQVMKESTDTGLVLDKAIEKLEGTKFALPQQFLGFFNSVSHSVGQDGGTTSINMTHVRKHHGTDDGLIEALVSRDREFRTKALRVVLKADDAFFNRKLLKFLEKCTPKAQKDPKTKKTKSLKDMLVKVKVKELEIGEILTPKPSPPILTQKLKGFYGGEVVAISVTDSDTTIIEGKEVYNEVELYEKFNVSTNTITPIEEIIRPGWVSGSYHNANIGDRIYEPFLGCKSIVDSIEKSYEYMVAYKGLSSSIEVVDPFKENEPDVTVEQIKKQLSDSEDSKVSKSIESAINYISFLYSSIKESKADVENFIRDITTREIATLEDILGSDDLKYSLAGTKATVIEGIEGFHSRAVHSDLISKDKPLAGLVESDNKSLPRLDIEKSSASIPPSYDVRYKKRDAVLSYKQELNLGVGFRG